MIMIEKEKEINLDVFAAAKAAEQNKINTEKYIKTIKKAHQDNKYLDERLHDMAYALIISCIVCIVFWLTII